MGHFFLFFDARWGGFMQGKHDFQFTVSAIIFSLSCSVAMTAVSFVSNRGIAKPFYGSTNVFQG